MPDNKNRKATTIRSPGILHELPADVETVLLTNTDLLSIWNNLTTIQRNEWICWITIVKKEATRAAHIQQMQEQLRDGQRQPCCWPGCPHRRPSAQKWFRQSK
jgi:uncharacterized protein YdeI (YjbR/CyaY-like superfamily)